MERKILYGTVGVLGAGVVTWRSHFPWISHDIQVANILRSAQNKIETKLRNGDHFIDLFEQNVEKNPDKVLLIHEDTKYTYGFVNAQANRVANVIKCWKIELCETVAIMIYNDPEFVWTLLGLMKLGIPVALINFNVRKEVLMHYFKICDTKYLILGKGKQLLDAIEDVKSELKIPVYVQDEPENLPEGYSSFNVLASRSPPTAISKVKRKHLTPYSHEVYIFTSGTTGLPKAVIFSLGRQMHLAPTLAIATGLNENDVIYNTLPLYHSASCTSGLFAALITGCTMVLTKKFSANDFFSDCKRYDVTVIQYIGELCRYLLAQPKSHLDTTHKIRFAMGNGLRKDIWADFQKRFNIPHIYEFFGASDGTCVFVNLNNKLGACGRHSPILAVWGKCLKAAIGDELNSQFQPSIVQTGFEIAAILVTEREFPRAEVNGSFFHFIQAIWRKVQNVGLVKAYREVHGPQNLERMKKCHPLSSQKLMGVSKMALVKYDEATASPIRDKHGRCVQISAGEQGLVLSPLPTRSYQLQEKFYKGDFGENEKKLVRNVFVDGDVYFNFGDVLYLDKDYFVYFRDRIGDTFRWKGENVSTTQVADTLTSIDFIEDASVYGVEIPGTDGKAGMAALYLTNGDNKIVTEEMLKTIYRTCKDKLPSYARPIFLRFPKEMPLTSTFKHSKVEFKKEAYDISVVDDPLFFVDNKTNTYIPLTQNVFTRLKTKARL